jgi:hypothetical protein
MKGVTVKNPSAIVKNLGCLESGGIRVILEHITKNKLFPIS